MAKDDYKKEKKKKQKDKRVDNSRVEEKRKDKFVKIENKKEETKEEIKEDSKGKTKYYFEMWEVIVIMIITTLFGLFIGSFLVYKKYNNDKIICNDVDDNVSAITTVYNELVKDYYGDINKDNLVDSAIGGMIDGLDDPYALYVNGEDALLMDEELNGTYVGLGMEIVNDHNQLKVYSVFDDSPAFKAGIKPGDVLVSIGSLDVTIDNIEEVLKDIKTSKIGTKKVINVLRDGDNIRKDIKLDLIDVKSVFSSVSNYNNKKIGIIKISNFASNTYGQFVEEYNNLKEENVEAIVIDLRDNGGGYVTSVYSIASMFLEKDDIIYQKTNGEKVEKIIDEYDKTIDLPVVLLVNGFTASSSEIFASSLKENINVSIVGTKTYGKGTIQKMQQLGEDRYIKYTVQEWLTPKGNRINGIGITPDVVIPFDDKLSYDVQLEKALEVVSNKIGG